MLYDLKKLLFLCEHIIKYLHVLGDFGLIAGRSLKKLKRSTLKDVEMSSKVAL
jgi:hypothetical protein